MFKESIVIKENKIIITVSCEMRKLSFEKKEIYNEKPERLIPENLKNKCTLISSPSLGVSNCEYLGYTNEGQWVYEITQPKTTHRVKNQKPRTTNTRAKRKAQNETKKN